MWVGAWDGIQARLLGIVRLTVRPGLQLVNALPEMDMSIAYRVPAKAELKLPAMNPQEVASKSGPFRDFS